jgi:hypothetical protein
MNKTTVVIWIIFAALLLVLLPHTAWAFSLFEDTESAFGKITPWAAAIAFEMAIAALTHKLAGQIATVKRGTAWQKFSARYINAYGIGLAISLVVSATANISHASAYARPGYGGAGFVIVFGGILPMVSLLFARVLSAAQDAQEDETSAIEELQKTKVKLDRLQGEHERMKTALQDARKQADLWKHLNPQAQAAAMYITKQYATLGEAASAAGVHESTISRLAASMNHAEKVSAK